MWVPISMYTLRLGSISVGAEHWRSLLKQQRRDAISPGYSLRSFLGTYVVMRADNINGGVRRWSLAVAPDIGV